MKKTAWWASSILVAVGAWSAAGVVVMAGGAESKTPTVTIRRNDPRFDALFPKDAVVELLADGYAWTEGPVWDKAKARLLFSDIPGNRIISWTEGKGAEVFLKPSGYTGTAEFTGREPGSNGLAFDTEGRLLLCQHGDRRIARLEADGKFTTLADRYEGKRLNSPNDLILLANGDLLFTDPAYGLPKTFDDPARELPFTGVYRRSKDGTVTLLVKDQTAPNGIALSPDGKTLYVANSDPKRAVWMAYEMKTSGPLGAGRVFFDSTMWVGAAKPGLPDGMKLDAKGNLFATGPGGLHVFAPDGTLLGTIDTGVPTANCGWGGDGSILYITANTALLRVKTTTKGQGF
jgi:gluconolactonase